VVHVDTDPLALDRHRSVDVPIVGDARVAIEALGRELERRDVDFGGRFRTEGMRRRVADSTVPETPRGLPT